MSEMSYDDRQFYKGKPDGFLQYGFIEEYVDTTADDFRYSIRTIAEASNIVSYYDWYRVSNNFVHNNTANLNIEAISTGSLSLDMALGIGGIPRGRIIEIYGPESSGKTTVALHAVAQAQKLGGEAAFIDVEHALDPVYANALGVDIDSLLVSQPDTGEQALEICEALVRSNAIDIVVVDSVAALVPKAEIEGLMGDTHVGLQARLMSQALRKLTACIAKSNCAVIFINQLREKVGVVYGSPEVTTGGRALKFYSSVRIEIRKGEKLKLQNEIIGSRTKAKIVKNKVAPPFKEVEFDIMYGEGISRVGEIVDLGVGCDVIQKSGSWFSYNGQKIGQGREKVKVYLTENPELMAEIEEKIKEHKDEFFGSKKPKLKKATLSGVSEPTVEKVADEETETKSADIDIDIAVED